MSLRLFISGAMRGGPGLNFAAFDEAAERFRQRGYTVFNPAEYFRDVEKIDPFNPPVITSEMVSGWNAVMGAKIAECDAVHMLPGWEQSEGSRHEKTTAESLGKQFIE